MSDDAQHIDLSDAATSPLPAFMSEPTREQLVAEMGTVLGDIKGDLEELRTAFRDVREVLLDGLDRGSELPQRDYLREIANVLTRPTIARFTRGA